MTIAFNIFATCLWKCIAANVYWNQSAEMLANAQLFSKEEPVAEVEKPLKCLKTSLKQDCWLRYLNEAQNKVTSWKLWRGVSNI